MSAALSCFILSVARVVPACLTADCSRPTQNHWFPCGVFIAVCFENKNVYFRNTLAPRCVARLCAPTCARRGRRVVACAVSWCFPGSPWCGSCHVLKPSCFWLQKAADGHRASCDRDFFLRTHPVKIPQITNAIGRWACLQCWRPAVIC